jgi:hypothetical protein
VVADELFVLRHRALEPACEALVQLGAAALGDAGVGGIADEDVPEAKGVLLREARACAADQLLAREPL